MNRKLVYTIVGVVAALGVIGVSSINIPMSLAVDELLARTKMIDRIDLKIGSRMTGIRTMTREI